MSTWYYMVDGREIGPLSSPALKLLADSGRLKPNDKVRRENTPEWRDAKAVAGLFAVGRSETGTSTITATTTVASPGGSQSPGVSDLASLKPKMGSVSAPKAVVSAITNQDKEVLAELETLQKLRPGWWQAIGLFAVSLVLYVGAESTNSVWNGVLIIVPILLFHELGHYVAMRSFGYRNLRMFFIPFFGAAVSGQHYNIDGWKKAVVSLAGPLPGIAIGVPLAVVGLILSEPKLLQVSLLALIINGFNLLPILPLDGGRVASDVLFVRHPLLDAVFRIVAVFALIGVAILLRSWIFFAIAVAVYVELPTAYLLARIARQLKDKGFAPVSINTDSIPVPAAISIIAELRPDLPPDTEPKDLATKVASVFETLNAKPPNAFASLGLLGVHAVSFITAVLTIVLIVGASPHDATFDRPTVVVSSDGKHQITVPSGWSKQPLSDGATILVAKPMDELYVSISSEGNDAAKGFSLETYAELIRNQMTQRLSDSSSTNPTARFLNHNAAMRFELNGTLSDIPVKYIVTIIETKDDFVRIIAWTLSSQFDEKKHQLLEVVDSFKQTHPSP